MSKLIVLKSSDRETLELEEAVAVQSRTIKHLVEDECADDSIPIPNVAGEILRKTFEYCRRHAEAKDGEDLKNFDSEFMDVDTKTLYDLILAANYLNIKTLLDLTCQTVADMIKGKTPNEIREIFKITNDYTPEEEEHVLKDLKWAFEA